MNRQHLLQLSADLDRVINLSHEGEDDDWPRKTSIAPVFAAAGIGAGGILTHQAIQNAGGYATVGRKTVAGVSAGKKAVGRIYNPAGAATGLGNFLNKANLSRIGKSAKSAFTHTYSARHEKLVHLSAEMDQVINFDLAGLARKLLIPSVGNAALKWGGIGAAGGALAGGISGGLSDDPNKSALGGALSGAATGGLLGAAGGAGMRGYNIMNRGAARAAGGATQQAVASMRPAAAPSATAAADQMAAASPAAKVASVGKPSAYAEMPSGNSSIIQPNSVHDPMGYGIRGNTIDPLINRNPIARTTSTIRDPNTSVADALTNKRKSIYENGMNTPRGMKSPSVFSSRHQSLVQLSAELDKALTT